MKKRIFAVLLLLPLLAACHKAVHDVPVLELKDCVMAPLKGQGEFTVADEDFLEYNFSFEDEIEDAVVCLDHSGVREFGIFYLENDGNIEAVTRGINAYLDSERAALASLSALYPSDELTEKLDRYKNAVILAEGRYVSYFVLPQSEQTDAQNAFTTALYQ